MKVNIYLQFVAIVAGLLLALCTILPLPVYANAIEPYTPLNRQHAPTTFIDTSGKDLGFVTAAYNGKEEVALLRLVKLFSHNELWTCINITGAAAVFSLPWGDGIYSIEIYAGPAGKEIPLVCREQVTVALAEHALAPFLYASHAVSFSEDSAAVRLAAELNGHAETERELVDLILEHIGETIAYDFDRGRRVQLGEELPGPMINTIRLVTESPDETLASGSGICGDMAVLMAAMLRSQGVPAQVVVGEAHGISHAWVSVYIGGVGWQWCDPTSGQGPAPKEATVFSSYTIMGMI